MKTVKIWRTVSWLLVLTGLIFFTFSPSLKNGFVYWDEDKYLLNNTSIRDFSPTGLMHLFNPHVVGIYIPLTLLTYSVEYHFFQLSPLVYHIDNLILHLLNALLVLGLIYSLTSKFELALVTAALFGVFPLRVESVAWVMERKDVLYSFFYLGALISYIWFIKSHLVKYFWGALFLFICSLLAKPQAISFPLIMLAIDYYYKRPCSKSLILEKLPFCLIAVAFLGFTLFGIHHLVLPQQNLSFLLGGYTLVLYFIKSFVPFHLSCINPIPQSTHGFFSWIVYVSILILLIAGCFIVQRNLKFREMTFGLLFYVVLMALPILNMRYGHGLFYEHYTYLASIGLYFIFAMKYIEWLDHAHSRKLKQGIIFLLGGYLLVMAWVSFERCGVWKNSMTLWTDVYPKENEPYFAVVYNNLGNSYEAQGNWTQAIFEYNRSIELNSNYAGSYFNRGNAYFQQGNIVQAISDYSKAIELNPDLAKAYYNRSICYAQLRNIKDEQNKHIENVLNTR